MGKATATAMILFGFLGGNQSINAQVISDRTTNTKVRVQQNVAEITGGIQAGDNLFHSFKQFSLDTNGVANFDHSLAIANIFSRVTGGIASEIDGLIQTQGNANLFLINPTGIIFGANAQLNVAGSFVATTAQSVIFADQTEFQAIAPKLEGILTITAPVGLQYGNAGDIALLPNANRGASNSGIGLGIQPNQTLALVGGDVSLARNNLNSISSKIEISSIKYGKVGLSETDSGWQFDYDQVKALGKIDLSNRALINSSGIVNLYAQNIDFNSSSGIRNFTDLNSTGGKIQLEATKSINLDNSFLFTQVGQVSPNLEQAIASAAGDIAITAPQITVNNGSVISAGTLSQGTGGNITLNATESISLSSTPEYNPAIVSTSTQGLGKGGQIEVNTGTLVIDGGSQIQALAGKGSGGTIKVNASQAINLSGTGILRSRDSQRNQTETILASGFTASSGVAGLPVALRPQGESGNLIINTPELTLKDSASISVNNYGLADAGDIRINISNLNLDTTAAITANTASGAGGSINILADKSIILDRQGAISTTAEQAGDGGNISIEADNLLLLSANRISANAQQGSGGNIAIDTQGLFINPNSKITASSRVETQTGTVKIVTLDLNSRLSTGYQDYRSFVSQDYIDTGCGVKSDFANNSFRDIGRGGIPLNPLETTSNWELLADFGQDRQQSRLTPSAVPLNDHASPPQYSAITEADTWQINSQGKVELIAEQHQQTIRASSTCQFQRSPAKKS